jgi:hypothetical protein
MKQIIVLLMTLSLIACNSIDKPKEPENLISKDKMVDILYDVFVINAAKGTSKGILEDNGIYPEDYVFKKHQIDSLQFALSNEYYGFHMEEYESIIARVEERFNTDKDRFQARIDKDKEDKQRKKDSIKKLSDTLKIIKSRKFPTSKKPDSINPQVDSK